MSYFGEKGSDTAHAADLERRRIRRRQAWIVRALKYHGAGCDDSSEGKWFARLANDLVAATSAKGKRK